MEKLKLSWLKFRRNAFLTTSLFWSNFSLFYTAGHKPIFLFALKLFFFLLNSMRYKDRLERSDFCTRTAGITVKKIKSTTICIIKNKSTLKNISIIIIFDFYYLVLSEWKWTQLLFLARLLWRHTLKRIKKMMSKQSVKPRVHCALIWIKPEI